MLADKDQRAVYDEQGIVDEESDSLDQDRNWEEHWRRLFPKVFHLLVLYVVFFQRKLLKRLSYFSVVDHIARDLGL